MLDLKKIRDDINNVAANLATRGFKLDIDYFMQLEEKRKELQVNTQKIQSLRNTQSKDIGIAKQQGIDIKPLLQQIDDLSEQLKSQQTELEQVQGKLQEFLAYIPNEPDSTAPYGESEAGNVMVRDWRDMYAQENSLVHYELGNNLQHSMDFASAARLSGSRFVVLKGAVAKLHRALAQYMLQLHTDKHGYTEVYTPYLVSGQALYSTGQLPKFSDDLFSLTDTDLWLIPTAEVSLTNLVREQIIKLDDLPLKLVAHTPCFRKEAGAYGKDTKGMLRQHQFDKVELVQIVHPHYSMQALEELTQHAEAVLQGLELPYRVMSLCRGDLGFSAAKTYDIEVWMAGQRQYREISSCSNTKDFQARRLQARYREKDNKGLNLVHTLNGSGVAIGRCLIAVMEFYQTKEGGIKIPGVLHAFMQAEYINPQGKLE